MGDAIFLFAFKGINFNNVAVFEKVLMQYGLSELSLTQIKEIL